MVEDNNFIKSVSHSEGAAVDRGSQFEATGDEISYVP